MPPSTRRSLRSRRPSPVPSGEEIEVSRKLKLDIVPISSLSHEVSTLVWMRELMFRSEHVKILSARSFKALEEKISLSYFPGYHLVQRDPSFFRLKE
jgi:hypothetical protein